MMRISIVTPSFNQGIFIAEAIESVLAQKYDNFEHIIVDNCSTDKTAEVLARYPHLKVISQPDIGQSDALNKGFKVATGDIIGWLNADDSYAPGCFKAIARAFADSPDRDFIYGDYKIIDVNGTLLKVRKEIPFDWFILKYLHVLYIPSTASFFRRKVIDEGNLLDTAYHLSMDYEFFVRLAAHGYRFLHIPVTLANFRWHEDAKSQKQAVLQDQERERALLRHDSFLGKVPASIRSGVRFVLLILVRAKRTMIKFFCGCYSARS